MNPNRLLILTPATQACSCGLADHARVIGNSISRRGSSVEIANWPSCRQLAGAILLEFTPLAYSRVGLSWPLLIQVAGWRLKARRLVTYFHELPFANGPGGKRWLAVQLQRVYCMLLAGLSSHAVVNQPSGLKWLQVLCGARRLSFLPVCSNVGESEHAPAPTERPLQVVVFGSPGKRRHAHDLVAARGGYHRLFGPSVRVVDIGEPLPLPHPLASEVEALGHLPAAVIAAHLLNSRFGFFYAEPDQFSKSGVFAAYCAHGVVPILAHEVTAEPDYYLTPQELNTQSPRVINPLPVWQNCRRWYTRSSASAAADHLYRLLCPPSP